MPKTVFVTRGEWAGRYMRLEDDMAAKALSDGWAREGEAEPEEFDPANLPPPPPPPPESLVEYESEADEDDGDDDDDEPSEDGEPKPKRKYQKRKK
jgi:hypothetical protein